MDVAASTTPPIELVRQGCGWGWHRAHWRDHWGYWHWGGAFRIGDFARAEQFVLGDEMHRMRKLHPVRKRSV